jgi:glycosyltransferase involved in cell wall biosynthesis
MKLLGYVTDGEAKSLMQSAKAFLFPSFCEGFGMPPLEALSAGTPRIIVSDIPVMHEIFNDNAIYINPNQYNYDLEQMLAGSYCDADSVLNKFSWENSAEKLLLTLRKE